MRAEIGNEGGRDAMHALQVRKGPANRAVFKASPLLSPSKSGEIASSSL